MRSIWPFSSRNSDRWNPFGSSFLIVVAITRGPANPIRAPGSAISRSHTEANEAVTPPVVGCVITEIDTTPFWLSFVSAPQVLAICMSETAPSCMRAPPEQANRITGRFFSAAISHSSAIFSPTTMPIEPPRNEKFITPSAHGMPLIWHTPVTIASDSPVFALVCTSFSPYGTRSLKPSTSVAIRSVHSSSKVPGSAVSATRSRAGSVKW